MYPLTRRRFLHSSLAGSAGLTWLGSGAFSGALADDKPRRKLPVAGVTTVYHHNSHADVILGKILEGWEQDGGPGPDLELVSLYTDQIPENDLSVGLAQKHGFLRAKTIHEALTLGTDKLAVAGVLIVGEHGNYPTIPETQQIMFPRRRFFDEVAATFRKCGKIVPVFNDKHLSYAFADARHMYDTAREMQIPFMAGSSIPMTWRAPSATIPIGSEVTEAIALGYGPLDAYGFHTIEGMQCLVERRKGGETGVKSIQAVQGDAIQEAERQGRWSKTLFDAVVEASPTPNAGKSKRPAEMSKDALFFLIEYRDGTKATVAMGTGFTHEFSCGVTIRGEPKPFALTYVVQEGVPFGHFSALLRAVEHMVHSGKPAYPVERTLLTTGILDTALHSFAEKYRKMETPQLAIEYQPADWPFNQGVPAAPRG